MTGHELIVRWREWFKAYIVMSDAQATLLAVYAIGTWFADRFSVAPYLSVTAHTKRSGKTTVLDCLLFVCRGAEKFATIMPKAIVRLIDQTNGKITVLIDEAEKLSNASLGDTRTMLATGYRRGATHPIPSGRTVIRFPTFCWKVFASIGDIQDVLRDRSIVFDLQRGMPSRMLSENWEVAQAEANDLIQELAKFSRHAMRIENMDDATARIPFVPADWLSSPRDREIWTPLFSVARAFGLHKDDYDQLVALSVDISNFKEWISREHGPRGRAYHDAAAERDATDKTMADRLLRDMLTVLQPFVDAGHTHVHSSILVDALRGIHTAPWRSWNGQGLNEINLAALVSAHGLAPKVGQMGKGKTRKQGSGYKVADIRAAAKSAGIVGE